jgi:hypothetical protein
MANSPTRGSAADDGAPDPGRLAHGRTMSEGLIYAGIGSRHTPAETLERIESLASTFAASGWTLRTGGSPGADQSFYRGAVCAHGGVELYLPWPGFEATSHRPENALVRTFSRPSDDARALASRFHPDWDRLSPASRSLLARDGHQVLGDDLATPAQLVVCWTVDGGVDGLDPRSGGTGQALRIAHHHRLPVLNLARADHVSRAWEIAPITPADRRLR